jgi:Big-like domain-containing protein
VKRFLLFAAAGLCVGYAASCIDFDQSQKAYCDSLTCRARAQVCQDGPQINKVVPDRGAANVALNTNVVVTYDQPVTCTDAGITLVQYTGGEPVVPGSTACTGGTTAVFTPSVALLSGRVYKVYVNDCETFNDAGIGGLDASWTFTTQ